MATNGREHFFSTHSFDNRSTPVILPIRSQNCSGFTAKHP
jgi:hypothetical protein